MELELFDRYVREVGRRLPKKQRADVGAELHSLLLDALQDRLAEQEAEAEATEEDQVPILQELGPPAKMAAQYAPPNRYLIGPRFYDMYLIVAAAVAGAITLAHLVLLVVALWGGVNGHLTVEQGTTADVCREVREAMNVLAPGGGFILSPVDNVRESTPRALENSHVLIDEWRRLTRQ